MRVSSGTQSAEVWDDRGVVGRKEEMATGGMKRGVIGGMGGKL